MRGHSTQGLPIILSPDSKNITCLFLPLFSDAGQSPHVFPVVLCFLIFSLKLPALPSDYLSTMWLTSCQLNTVTFFFPFSSPPSSQGKLPRCVVCHPVRMAFLNSDKIIPELQNMFLMKAGWGVGEFCSYLLPRHHLRPTNVSMRASSEMDESVVPFTEVTGIGWASHVLPRTLLYSCIKKKKSCLKTYGKLA